jgi:galactitol-specific phosphotransferase system IIB component
MTRICICCGVAINSSTVGYDILDEEIKRRKIKGVTLEKVMLADADVWLPRADVVVTFLLFTVKTDKPVISGVPLFAGGRAKRQELLNEILSYCPESMGK